MSGLINSECSGGGNEDEKMNGGMEEEIKDGKGGDDGLRRRIDRVNSGVRGCLDEVREKVSNKSSGIEREVERGKGGEEVVKDCVSRGMENEKDDLVGICKDMNDEGESRVEEDRKVENNIDRERVNGSEGESVLENKISEEV